MKRQRINIGGGLGGKKHCIKKNRKKVHLPDNDSSSLFEQKTQQLLYENQRVNAAEGNNRCLF
jgi:hypothetical protein